jgi:hypothetical protein
LNVVFDAVDQTHFAVLAARIRFVSHDSSSFLAKAGGTPALHSS